MKLYHANTGQWFGTQADAKKAVGKHNFSEVDVPTDKWGLIGWLNAQTVAADFKAEKVAEFEDNIINGNPDTEIIVLKPVPEPERVIVNVERFSRADRSIAIDDVIQAADFAEAVRIAEHATARVGEHLREIADARFTKPAHRYTKLEDLLS